MKNINSAVKDLLALAEKKYGPQWGYKVRDALSSYCSDWDETVPTKLKNMRAFFKSHGYDLLSCGAFRIVFGWNNVVFKIDCRSKDRYLDGIEGNAAEVQTYTEMLKTVPKAKYFICPLLKTVKIKKKIVLVYPKVEVYGEENFATTRAQEDMSNISDRMFDDMHAYNKGKFCNGLVAIDFNFGSEITPDHNKDITRFAKRHKTFWKKYVTTFNKALAELQNTYALA
jgi:hypothetical protein